MAKTGRPPKYKKEYCEGIIEYCRGCDGEYRTLEGYADAIGVCVDTLHEWRKQHPEFSEAYNRAKNAQKAILIEGGLTGRFNTQFAKFVAINCHGMSEKQDLNIGGQDDNNLEVKITVVD